MAELKRGVKDSVFTCLFQQPKYMRQLYLVLHPEDTDVREEDFKLVTLENVLATGLYNDLGFQVRNRLLLLVEAQSTFSVNITLRLLMYLANTYKVYVEENKLDLYGSRAVHLPRPELYVIYTGDKKHVPETLCLSDLYEGRGGAEIQVKVLRGGSPGDILAQYVRFCQITDEKRQQYGRTKEAIEAIIDQCIQECVLAPFLTAQRKEVHDIMTFLFDHDTIMDIHDYNIAKDAEEKGIQKGMRKGIQEGMQKGMQKGMQTGMQKGMQEGLQTGLQRGQEAGIRAMVSTLQELSVDREIAIQKLAAKFGLLPQAAEEKVAQYWLQ